jgi:hypothetical protein
VDTAETAVSAAASRITKTGMPAASSAVTEPRSARHRQSRRPTISRAALC